MAQKSSIETTVAPDDLADFQRLLAEGRSTIDAATEFLRARGYEISRSSVGRYAKQYETVVARMRQSRQFAEALGAELADAETQGRQGRVLVEMARSLIFELMSKLSDGGEIDTKDVMQLGKGLSDLSRALRLDQDFELKIRDEARRKAAEAAVKAAEKALDGGLDREELCRKIREDIYGFSP